MANWLLISLLETRRLSLPGIDCSYPFRWL